MVATIMAVMLIAYGIVNWLKAKRGKEGDEGRQRKKNNGMPRSPGRRKKGLNEEST